MKLHLGCGRKYLEGYINIDAKSDYAEIKADLYHDNLMDIPGVEPSSVEEILLVHVIEHLWPIDVPEHMAYWHYLLRKGGKLIIEAPDVDKLFSCDVKLEQKVKWVYGHSPSRNCHDLHKGGWCYALLEPLLRQAGFSEVEEFAPQFHGQRTWRDFRVVATK